MASHADERPFEKRIFGHFKAKGLMDNEEHLAFEAARYAYVGSPLALKVWSRNNFCEGPSWEPYIDLTVNQRPNDCDPTEIIVKTYSENAHLRDALLNLGYFTDTGRRIGVLFTELEIWSLTEKFEEAFDLAHPASEFA